MKNTNWKYIVEVVGISAIVGSLIFVGLQMRQAERLARVEIGTAILGPTIEMRSMIAEHGQVWRKGNAGEDLNSDESAVYEQLVLAEWNRAYWSDFSYARLGSDRRIASGQFAGFLFDNPGARWTWQSVVDRRMEIRMQLNESSGPNEAAVLIKADLEKLDALNN
jgi:hypothetical protein